MFKLLAKFFRALGWRLFHTGEQHKSEAIRVRITVTS
jgi:hypothetical protein